jgi:hypothetical protein
MAPSEATRKIINQGPQATGSRGHGVNWAATAIRSSAPPVSIVGSARRYRGGGFRVNV